MLRPPYPRQVCPLIFALLASLLLTGCVPLRLQRIDQPFDGLESTLGATAEAGGTLRVLVVHGMGYHPIGYSEGLVQGLSQRLQLAQEGTENTATIFQRGIIFGYLRTVDFTNGARRLRVYEVTWSPITEWVKDEQFALDRSLASERELLNRHLKSGLLNNAISDAILYTGAYRPNMQYPIRVGLRRLLDDGAWPKDQIAIVTSSLGSYMTFDTLRSSASGTKVKDFGISISAREAQTMAENTSRIYMLANQIPLLELTELSEPVGLASTNRLPAAAPLQLLQQPNGESKAGSPLRDFVKLREPAVLTSKAQADFPRKLQIVAFSDPNDLLSYPLEPSNYTGGGTNLRVSAANVDLIIARWSYLGIVANPVTAHTGWSKDKKALDLMVYGASSPRNK